MVASIPPSFIKSVKKPVPGKTNVNDKVAEAKLAALKRRSKRLRSNTSNEENGN